MALLKNRKIEKDFEEKKVQDTDRKGMLDKKGFVQFLTKFDDSENYVNFDQIPIETLSNRHTTFEEKMKTERSLKNFYRTELKESLGIELDDDDLEAVTDYIDELALKNETVELLDLQKKLDLFSENKRDISSKESELKKLMPGQAIKDTGEKMKEMRDTLKNINEVGGSIKHGLKWTFGTISEDNLMALDILKEQYKIDRKELKKRVGESEKVHEKIESIKIMHKEMRESFFDESFGPAKEVIEKATKKADEQLSRMKKEYSNDNSFENATNLKDYLNLIKAEEERSGINYTDESEEIQSEWIKHLDEDIVPTIKQKILDELKLNEVGTLREVGSVLKKFFEMDSIGSLKGDGVKTFVLDVIKGASEDNAINIGKRWFINELIKEYE